jgi:hypothetical protein
MRVYGLASAIGILPQAHFCEVVQDLEASETRKTGKMKAAEQVKHGQCKQGITKTCIVPVQENHICKLLRSGCSKHLKG